MLVPRQRRPKEQRKRWSEKLVIFLKHAQHYTMIALSGGNANKELLSDLVLPACWKSSERVESVGRTVISSQSTDDFIRKYQWWQTAIQEAYILSWLSESNLLNREIGYQDDECITKNKQIICILHLTHSVTRYIWPWKCWIITHRSRPISSGVLVLIPSTVIATMI